MSLFSRAFQTLAIRLTVALLAVVTLGLLSPAVQAQIYTEQTLHSFTGGATDGASPQAGLVAINGILYGTTNQGGSSNDGTIFSYNLATNTETTLYQFTGTGGDGANPRADLLNINGILYGSTMQGGSGNNGILFSYNTTTHTETILHIFNGADGNGPQCLLLPVGGKLYGVTPEGGSGNYGSIFSINPDGTGFQSLYGFILDGSNGANPVADLIDVDGIFYGNTFYGGSADVGAVFSFDPATNAVTTLARFPGGTSGAHPGFGLTNVNGTFYGTTTGIYNQGTGTIYSIKPDGTGFQTVHAFGGSPGDGANPFDDFLLINGILYGTTNLGGGSNDGTVFSFDPATNTETVLYSFLGQAKGDGNSPLGALINVNGVFYGTTQAGGSADEGALYSFKITPTAPTARNDNGRGYYKTALVIAAPGVLGNDSNGGSPITASLVSGPTHGTLTFNSNGGFTYTPTGAYLGTDSFTYQDKNAIGTSNTATVTLTVQPRTPIAVNNSNLVKYETAFTVPAPGVLGNDDNGGSSPMTAQLVTSTSHGTLTLNSSGSFTYTPAADFSGTDSFTYQAVNSVGKSNIATALLTVQPSAPIAHDDHGHAYYNTTLNISAPGVLGNDDTGGKPITAKLVSSVSHGTLTFNSDGSFKYTPTAGYLGTDSFTYQATNDIGASNTATCAILVQARTPIAYNDAGKVTHNTTATFAAPAVLGNDYLGTNGTVTAALVTNPSHGTITFNGDGSFKYTPTIGFLGTDSFTYKDTNSVGTSNTATCTLTVQ